MPARSLPRIALLAGLVLCTSASAADAKKPAAATLPASGGTRVLKWKDGKQAVFMLAFDDACPTHLKNAIPELEKRKIVGNFYVVTGNALWTTPSLKAAWQAAAKSPYVALQNHTFHHKGAATVEEFDREVAQCNAAIYEATPGRKNPRIIGYGQPGGVPWKISKDEMHAVLARHHLADRPPFFGPPLTIKSLPACLAVIDTALTQGEMGHLDFHGVGGDWHVTPLDWYRAILDKLDQERDRLWIADVVDWHKYVAQRNSATLKELAANDREIRVQLTSSADPAYYDLPLTLRSKVPGNWKQCTVRQGPQETRVGVVNGEVTYDALPGGGEIVIRPAASTVTHNYGVVGVPALAGNFPPEGGTPTDGRNPHPNDSPH